MDAASLTEGVMPGTLCPLESHAARSKNNGPRRELPKELLVHRHELGVEFDRERDEFTVIRRAVAVANKLKHATGIHLEFRS